MAQAWTFEQLGGEKKILTLSGWGAPFGRPRQKAVTREKIVLRHTATRYHGQSTPTRHIFGHHWEDGQRLNGRWMDKDLGPGGTNDQIDNWQTFVSDEQPVRISWGAIVSYVGLIESLEIGRESEAEATWDLAFLIDTRDGIKARTNPSGSGDASLLARQLAQENPIFSGAAQKIKSSADWQPDVLDALDSLFSNVAAASAALNKISNEIQTFETASISVLQRFRGAIHQFKTASLALRDAVDSYEIHKALFTRQADADIQWFLFRSQADVDFMLMQDLLADADKQAELAERGRATTSYVAKIGDTWESISNIVYGGPSGANKIRQANGIRYGQLPVPGTTYQIPIDATSGRIVSTASPTVGG